MNEENGLMTLDDKSIDLGLTDPPYNVKYDQSIQYRKDLTNATQEKHNPDYNDIIENYAEWCKTWFKEIRRICNQVVFTCGTKNLHLWFDIEEPKEILIHYKKNCQSVTGHCRYNIYEPILIYGHFKGWKFHSNVFDIPVMNGFLRNRSFIHSSVKELELYKCIIEMLKPKSVLDCFMGSGTTAEACTKLGIKWIGYEINKAYKVDIDKRLKNCKPIKKKIQHNLMDDYF